VDLDEWPPVVISHLITGLSRSLINEETMGVTDGHGAVLACVGRLLDAIEAKAARQAAG
jgi:hypothetical protein